MATLQIKCAEEERRSAEWMARIPKTDYAAICEKIRRSNDYGDKIGIWLT